MAFQRLRDPVHDLIELGDTPFDRMIWRLLDSEEFQRLRRVRQLGFSDFVFPGATHSRFAHSVGVFHTARVLCAVLKEKLGGDFVQERADVAICAALLHDLGHGPFSHAFEQALGEDGKHEDWTQQFISSPPLSEILDSFRRGFTDEVLAIFRSETSPDIYSSIVTSQFDADRLDYMRRDRLMSGTQLASIDFTWLLRNLEVGKIVVGSDDERIAEVETFVLGEKALWAGEQYVLSLFHLYPAVYLHKTTRGAEKIFGKLLKAVEEKVKEGRPGEAGLPDNHPIVRYLRERTLAAYADLDDAVIWGALPQLSSAADPLVKEFAHRLRFRRLLKAHDVRSKLSGGRTFAGGELEQRALRFRRAWSERVKADQSLQHRVLTDAFTRDPYKKKSYDSPEAIRRIHIMQGGQPIDLAHVSPVVNALQPFHVHRVYVAAEDENAQKAVDDTIREAAQ